jgi:hypothetical protein
LFWHWTARAGAAPCGDEDDAETEGFIGELHAVLVNLLWWDLQSRRGFA